MTLYDDLGVKKDATPKEIKKGFKKESFKHHPDRGGDEKKFQKVHSSYMILKDEHKRKSYDDLGEVVVQETSAETNLRNMFAQVVTQGFFERDILTIVTSKTQEEEDKARKGIESNEEYLFRLKKQLGRFVTKDKNIYESVIKQNIRKSELNIEGFKNMVTQCNDIYDMIHNYNEVFDNDC